MNRRAALILLCAAALVLAPFAALCFGRFPIAAGEALSALSEAKQLHDEIEAVYNPHVDFDGVYSLCDLHIKNMLRI